MYTETITTHYLELEDCIPFGKYKDQHPILILIMADFNYIKWFQKNIKDYKFTQEVLDAIKEQETLNYAEWVSKNFKRNSNDTVYTEIDLDMGGGSRDSESENGWAGSDNGWGFEN
jgi:hypothetical protein